MKVTVYGTEYECSKSEKGNDFVRLYDERGNVFAEFLGISNFSGYLISGGDWSVPEPTQEQRIAAIETVLAKYPDMRQALEELGVVFGG